MYNFKPTAVFITHCHSDHSYRLTNFVSRQTKPIFFMPNEMVDNLENYLMSSLILSSENCITNENCEITHITKGIKAGDVLTNFCKNNEIGAYVIDCCHSAICCGYGFFARKKKLMKQYQGLTQKELQNVRSSGKEIMEIVEIPLFIFLGDTDIETFNIDSQN